MSVYFVDPNYIDHMCNTYRLWPQTTATKPIVHPDGDRQISFFLISFSQSTKTYGAGRSFDALPKNNNKNELVMLGVLLKNRIVAHQLFFRVNADRTSRRRPPGRLYIQTEAATYAGRRVIPRSECSCWCTLKKPDSGACARKRIKSFFDKYTIFPCRVCSNIDKH